MQVLPQLASIVALAAAVGVLVVLSAAALLALGTAAWPGAGRRDALMAGAVLAFSGGTLALRGLALAQLFAPPAVAACGAVAVVGAGWLVWRRPLGGRWGPWRAPWDAAWLPVAAGLGAVAVSLFAAGKLPVWQWDALGYHLPFVQLVLQDHGMAHLPPGAEYIDTYPHGVELLFAGWRALLSDDTWVDAAQIPFGLLAAAAVAALARQAGARWADSLAAGALWLLLPAVFVQLPTNYVDVATAAYLLLAVYWVLAEPGPPMALLGGLALGLVLSAKPSTPPAVAVLGAMLLARLPRGQRRWIWGAGGLALAVGGEAYLRNLWLHGNPVWPVSVGLGPWRLPGNDDLHNLLVSGAAAPHLSGPLLGRVAGSWFTAWAPLPIFDMRVGGWGPLFWGLVPAALWAVFRQRLAWLGAAVVAVAVTPDPAVARYVLAMPGVLLAAAAVPMHALPARRRAWRWVGATALAVAGAWHALPGLTGQTASLLAADVRGASSLATGPTASLPAAAVRGASPLATGPTASLPAADGRWEDILGPDGPLAPWARARQALAPGEAAATDGMLGLPYLLWRSDGANRVEWVPASLHGGEVLEFLAARQVRLLAAADGSAVGDVVRAHPERFVPVLRCGSDPCGLYRVGDGPLPAAKPIQMALTFDDLPGDPNDLRRIAETLRQHGVPPVYGFVNGKQLETLPAGLPALQAWVAAGERVGNHTYSHANLADLDVPAYLADVRRNEPLLASLGAPAWRVFRYPYLREGFDLAQRHALRADLRARGYTVAQVSADTLDFLWDVAYKRCLARGDAAGAAALRARFLDAAIAELQWSVAAAQQGFGRDIHHILLAHSRPFTAAVLDDLLHAYERLGVQYTSLDQATDDPVYSLDPDIKTDGDNFLEQLIRARHNQSAPARPDYPRNWVDAQCS